MNFKLNLQRSDAQRLQAEYISGDQIFSRNQFDHTGTIRVLNSIDITLSDQGGFISEERYKKRLKKMKMFLDHCNINIFMDLFLISKSNYQDVDSGPIDKGDYAIIVRLVNLAHKDKHYFIVLDGELIHVPFYFLTRTPDLVEEYIEHRMKQMSRNKLFKKLTFRKESVSNDKLFKTPAISN